MTIFIFDGTMDGLLTAVFDAFALKLQPEMLLREGEQLPLFCDFTHQVTTDEEKARRVWTGLEQRLSRGGLQIITISWQSEERELPHHLFNYIYKVFCQPKGARSIEHNASDPDVLHVRNTCRRVLHESQRMKQFLRFQKAKDGTYLGVVSPDHNVLPLIIEHFHDRFGDQPWLIYDAHRHYGYYYAPPVEAKAKAAPPVRITFENESAIPFDLEDGRLNEDLLSENDQLFQELWRTYFKAICIKERINPRKQLSDMPRRYWKYMTEKQKNR